MGAPGSKSRYLPLFRPSQLRGSDKPSREPDCGARTHLGGLQVLLSGNPVSDRDNRDTRITTQTEPFEPRDATQDLPRANPSRTDKRSVPLTTLYAYC